MSMVTLIMKRMNETKTQERNNNGYINRFNRTEKVQNILYVFIVKEMKLAMDGTHCQWMNYTWERGGNDD